MPPATATAACDKSPLRFHCLKLERPLRFTEAIYLPLLLLLFFSRSLNKFLAPLTPGITLRFDSLRVSVLSNF